MHVEFLMDSMKLNAEIFHSFFKAFADKDEFIRWKPQPDKWCFLEILCHLIDEEKEDFRTRVKFALENSSGQPPSIDPQGWVKSRNYLNQNYTNKWIEFQDERRQSIDWLKSLTTVDWNASFMHPKFGKFTAHYMLSNWVAHDYLHIKQMTRLRYDSLAHLSGENLKYAGEWR